MILSQLLLTTYVSLTPSPAAWIHFANNLSPAGQDVPEWPAYGSGANSLQIQGVRGTEIITDDFHREQVDFFLQNARSFVL